MKVMVINNFIRECNYVIWFRDVLRGCTRTDFSFRTQINNPGWGTCI